MEGWKSSGMTAREFGAREGLNENGLRGWSSRLGAGRKTEVPAVLEIIQVPGAFAKTSIFEVVLDEGITVRVPSEFESDGLRQLLAVLRGG